MNKQTILVTGATGNIGGGAAVELAKHGARLVLLGRRHEALKARADAVRGALAEAGMECQDSDISTLVVDFSDMESVRNTAAEGLESFRTHRTGVCPLRSSCFRIGIESPSTGLIQAG